MVVFFSEDRAMSDFRRKAISVIIGVLMAAGAASVAMADPPVGNPPQDPPPPSNLSPKHFWGQGRLAKANPSLTAILATTNNPSVVASPTGG